MGANSLWNHIWKRPLPHCAVSLHSALEWKIRRPNFQFLKIRLSFFVKICPNCVLFLIFFARCIIQFRWNQPTQRTETVPFFIDFFIDFFQFYVKLGIFYYILLWLWCTCQQFFLFLAQSEWPFLLYFFLQQCFCKLAGTSGWILPSTSKLSDW